MTSIESSQDALSVTIGESSRRTPGRPPAGRRPRAEREPSASQPSAAERGQGAAGQLEAPRALVYDDDDDAWQAMDTQSWPFDAHWMRAEEYWEVYGDFTLADLVPGTETRTAKGGRKMLAKATGQPDRLAIVNKDRWGRWSVVISRDPYTPPRPRYRDEGEFLASFGQ